MKLKHKIQLYTYIEREEIGDISTTVSPDRVDEGYKVEIIFVFHQFPILM